MSNLLMLLSWGLFYFLHTALAASKLKRILMSKWPYRYKWYRLFYSVFSSILFLGILVHAIYLPVELIFSPGRFNQYAGYMVATAGIIILLRSAKKISMGSFFGFKQNRPLILTLNWSYRAFIRKSGILFISACLEFFWDIF